MSGEKSNMNRAGRNTRQFQITGEGVLYTHVGVQKKKIKFLLNNQCL